MPGDQAARQVGSGLSHASISSAFVVLLPRLSSTFDVMKEAAHCDVIRTLSMIEPLVAAAEMWMKAPLSGSKQLSSRA
ncbi:hypothetical protein [Streptomyces sp. MS2.AVA.5]|uniref:Uncharacterized protein n=1 Tax=Streptomyces achmelvichensis TaxID=3134111 RepID=A0ACC6Q5B5_9ACTN